VDISRATLDGWVMTVGQLLIPLTAVMRRELLWGGYIQADETPVDVQTHDRRGKNHQAYLWQYGRPGGGVVFEFQMGRGRAGPKQFLEGFEGILQTDGYIGYEKVGGPKMVHVGCWAHYLDSGIIRSDCETGTPAEVGMGRAEFSLQIRRHKLSRNASSFGDGRHFRGAAGSSPARFQKASRTSRFI
jgi:hypothetical protein